MATDYIPRSDADFHVWQNDMLVLVEANAAAWEIPEASVGKLKTAQGIWTPVFEQASNPKNRTSADVQAKNDARKMYEHVIRVFAAQWLSANPNVPDSERQRLGLGVKDRIATSHGVPTSVPVSVVDFSVRYQHKISFTDEHTPTSKAKPTGVHGCEIWMKLGGEAPVSASELRYLATDTSSPYIVVFEADDKGKTAYYWLRWVNTKGERGPWSAAVSAIVAG